MDNLIQTSLWGEQFVIPVEDTSKILKKASNPKKIKTMSVDKQLKSKKVSIEDKMALIEKEVYDILGQYKDDTVTIRDYSDFVKYIDAAINNGIIAVDTETNNTLDVFNCLIMGLCIYTPGQKNAYIPVHHYNKDTGNLLERQLTESQIKEQLQRLVDNKVKLVFHNATFDIEVIYKTCDIKLHAYWDTSIGASILDENEHKSLKEQYQLHINPDQDKYDIEHLFKGLEYGIFAPELFALYAATDSFMTFKLYEYQKQLLELEDNKDIYNVFNTIEMPIIDVVVDMELAGVEVDQEYALKMSTDYHKRSEEIQKEIDEELDRLKPLIDTWRASPAANKKTVNKETGRSSKSKNEQLTNPIVMSSPTQLAILLYDVLNAPVIDRQNPRGTGEEILEELSKKLPICKLILKKRGVDILINTFIDKIPSLVKSDCRVHAKFNSYGTKTGRFSSGEKDKSSKQKSLNLQNIP